MKRRDHDQLIRFLKDHEPWGPPPPLDHTEDLLEKIEQEQFALAKQPSHPKKMKEVWWLSAVAVAGFLMAIGHRQFSQNLATISDQTLPTAALIQPQAIADQNLDNFIEESWSRSIGEHLYHEDELSQGYVDFVVNSQP
ncbi:hypothetical protein NIES970_21670 [[Synechococcus] sp. NIES-970]|uniref:hypothetical protein n=1 Tax=Picosynechococcus sp. NKBG15041c TaxID=1407650 RepID=UPI00040AC476|nr:hypothetical protein [Picosynechococcus sp. NKBG15041c]BAW97218.1 hypothetical protein NIES970_21670 [[Synechococcus] sp. NIES-970]